MRPIWIFTIVFVLGILLTFGIGLFMTRNPKEKKLDPELEPVEPPVLVTSQ